MDGAIYIWQACYTDLAWRMCDSIGRERWYATWTEREQAIARIKAYRPNVQIVVGS